MAKKEVMGYMRSQEEIELANKYQNWYKSAWQDKEQRGLFDKWELLDKYWEGDANLSESENDPACNTNIVHPNIEGQVALLLEQNVAITVTPTTPSEAPFAEQVRVILEWIKTKNKLIRKFDMHERRREKLGTGIFRVTFDPDFQDGFGLPVIDVCNPAYVFVDPNITDIYKIQEAEFIIEVMNKSIYWAKTQYGEEKANAIQAGFDPTSNTFINGEKAGEHDSISRNNYIHLLVWTKEEGKLKLVEMSGCGIILDEHTDFPNDRYPYFFTPLYARDGSIWGKGDAELLVALQDLINDLDDQMILNARLTGNPQRVVSASANIDVEDWTNEAGLIIPVADVNGLKYLQAPSIPDYIIRRRDKALDYERQILTRFSDQMAGMRQKGIDTATEVLALQEAGYMATAQKKMLFQETLSEVFEYCLEYVKEYWTEEQAFKITDKENDFIFFRGSDLKEIPQLVLNQETGEMTENAGLKKDALFDINITIGAGIPNNKAFLYNIMKESLQAGVILPQEYRKWLVECMGIPIELIPQTQPPFEETNKELTPEMMAQIQAEAEQEAQAMAEQNVMAQMQQGGM